AEFLAPEFAWLQILCGLCRAAGAALGLACEFSWRKILGCGWSLGFCFLPGGKILFLRFVGPLARPFLGFCVVGVFVGALVRSGC
ncbi:hypothetical protein, partial [Streptomyces sp. F001]|uniref:hypothetical protein n=1 Tax=Streptomyces sp. F001 TaxID=1510026 RepID=UPI0019D317E4